MIVLDEQLLGRSTSRISLEEEQRLVKLHGDKQARMQQLQKRKKKLIKTLEIVEQRMVWLAEDINKS
jgi:flagellar biosynthesis/type III secretory pathway chaperone